MKEQLREAYEQAIYYFEQPLFVVRTGVANQVLIHLNRSLNSSTWAIITAMNPRSQLLTQEENEMRHHAFCKQISNYAFITGVALDPAGIWPAERNALIFNLSMEEALQIASTWNQHAIIHGSADGLGKLVWCHSEFN